ncbi:MAG TPA: AAA family ATPase [Caulobacterales bacterium]|nr:AAA family ATPase [Caulobacterales bacterium]
MKPRADKIPKGGLLYIAAGGYDSLAPSFDFIPGLLHDRTVGIIYGPPGSGKTFLAIHLLCCAALGLPVFGRQPDERRGLYVGLEGESAIKARIQAWCAQHRVDSNPIDYALGSFDLLDDEGSVDGLIKNMKELGTQFVVIDTLSMAMVGVDEIAGRDMSLVLDALHKIKRETGACVVAIDHTGKNEKAGARGHSSKLGNVDTSIEILVHNKETKQEGKKVRIIEHPVKLGTPRSAKVKKQRDDEGGLEFRFVLTLRETATMDARGRPISRPALDESEHFKEWPPEEEPDAETAAREHQLTRRDREAIGVLERLTVKLGRSGPPSRGQFRAALEKARWCDELNKASWNRTFRRLIAKLEREGVVRVIAGDVLEMCK